MSREEDIREIRKKILAEGIEVTGRITACETMDNPNDPEHTIFKIDFEFEINNETVTDHLEFSINTMHLEYANHGGLLNVPTLECTPDDFKKALSAGQPVDIISLDTPPYRNIFNFNETTRTVLQYDAMWM